MEKPFKFRRVNEIAGAFVVILVILMATGILISGRIKGWFEPHRRYEVVLPEGGASGIREGSEVHILGTWAGAVSRVDLRHKVTGEWIKDISKVAPNEIDLVAVMELRSDLVAFVGAESNAVLKHDLGGFGAPYIEITRGATPRDPEARMLDLEKTRDVQEQLTEHVEDIKKVTIPAIEEFHKLTLSLSDPNQDFQKSIVEARRMLQQVNEGDGMLSVVLRDKETAEKLQKFVENTDQIMQGVADGKGTIGALVNDSKMSDDWNAAMADLNEAIESFDETMQASTRTAEEMQDTLAPYRKIGDSLQYHWLLRGAVRKEEAARAAASSSTASGPRPVPIPQSEAQSAPREKKGIFSRILPGRGDRSPKPERETKSKHRAIR